MDKLFDRPQFVTLFGGTRVNNICIFCLWIVCLWSKRMYQFSKESVVIWEARQSKFFDGFSSGSKLNNDAPASGIVLDFRDQHIKPFETAVRDFWNSKISPQLIKFKTSHIELFVFLFALVCNCLHQYVTRQTCQSTAQKLAFLVLPKGRNHHKKIALFRALP